MPGNGGPTEPSTDAWLISVLDTTDDDSATP